MVQTVVCWKLCCYHSWDNVMLCRGLFCYSYDIIMILPRHSVNHVTLLFPIGRILWAYGWGWGLEALTLRKCTWKEDELFFYSEGNGIPEGDYLSWYHNSVSSIPQPLPLSNAGDTACFSVSYSFSFQLRLRWLARLIQLMVNWAHGSRFL